MALEGLPQEGRFIVVGIAVGKRLQEHEVSADPWLIKLPIRFDKWLDPSFVVPLDRKALLRRQGGKVRGKPAVIPNDPLDVAEISMGRQRLILDEHADEVVESSGGFQPPGKPSHGWASWGGADPSRWDLVQHPAGLRGPFEVLQLMQDDRSLDEGWGG